MLLSISNISAHTSHYKGIKVINMDVFRNGKLIGYSNYFFTHGKNTLEVKNYTKFKVKLLKLVIFSISGESPEKYKDGKLVSYHSTTFQNDKEKYVKLKFDEQYNNFYIDGSSYKGKADINFIVGTWWNHEIIKAKAQISGISGRIIEQTVTFIGKEDVQIGDKTYKTLRFNFKSSDQTLPDSKKLNTDIWYEEDTYLWVKAAFDKTGYWEYRIKKVN